MKLAYAFSFSCKSHTARGRSHSPRSTSRMSWNSRSPFSLRISSTESRVASTSNPFDGEARAVGLDDDLPPIEHQRRRGLDGQRRAARLRASVHRLGADGGRIEAVVLL